MPRLPRNRGIDFDAMEFADSMMIDGLGGGGEGGEFGAPTEKVDKFYKSKNLMAERRRRDKLNSKLFTLRSLVPNITKMSKESTLIDAIDYINKLQSQIYNLNLELSNMPDEDGEKRVSASSSKSMAASDISPCPGTVELNPIGQNKFHVRMSYKNKRGGFAEMVEIITRNGLEITEISSVAFSGLTQTVFSIEAKGNKEICSAELRKKLLFVIVGAPEQK